MSAQDVFDTLRYRTEVDESGTRWYYNHAGRYHRDSGPAVEYATGSKAWHQNGQLHRTNGAAIEWANGAKFWYINGKCLSEDEYNQAVKLL